MFNELRSPCGFQAEPQAAPASQRTRTTATAKAKAGKKLHKSSSDLVNMCEERQGQYDYPMRLARSLSKLLWTVEALPKGTHSQSQLLKSALNMRMQKSDSAAMAHTCI